VPYGVTITVQICCETIAYATNQVVHGLAPRVADHSCRRLLADAKALVFLSQNTKIPRCARMQANPLQSAGISRYATLVYPLQVYNHYIYTFEI
jgi:hypothetical protein